MRNANIKHCTKILYEINKDDCLLLNKNRQKGTLKGKTMGSIEKILC